MSIAARKAALDAIKGKRIELTQATKSWEAAQKRLEKARRTRTSAQSQATAQRSRMVLKSSQADSPQKRENSEAVLAQAELEFEEAEADEKAQRGAFEAVRAELADLENFRLEAEIEEVEWKRRREELKGEIGLSKFAIRPARAAEKAAATAKHVVQKQVTKVERTQLRVEEAGSSAIERLKTEEYVADQVEQAYELKRKVSSIIDIGDID